VPANNLHTFVFIGNLIYIAANINTCIWECENMHLAALSESSS